MGCLTVTGAAGCSSRPQSASIVASSNEERQLLAHYSHPPTAVEHPETKASVFIFVLTDCPICNAYVRELNRIYDDFINRDVSLVVVPVDPDITSERFQAHADEYDARIPFVIGSRHDWIERAGATTAPEAAVFSPSGELLYRGRIDDQFAGLGKRRTVVTSHDLRDALEAILAGKPVREPRTEAIGCPIPSK
jgi:hypothetical protein